MPCHQRRFPRFTRRSQALTALMRRVILRGREIHDGGGMRAGSVSTALSALALVGAVVTLGALAERDDGLPQVAGDGIHVVDGDTVDFDGRRWRLVGYDTPEIYHAHCPRERHRAILAAARLVALIEAGAVLESQPGLDKYKRGLARLVLDGASVGDTLIAEGHARAYDGRSKRLGWCG